MQKPLRTGQTHPDAAQGHARAQRSPLVGAELDPEGDQVWFHIEEESIRRMPDRTPEARGRRLLEGLHVWLAADPALRCEINRFEVRVAANGDTWIERLRW